MNTENITLPARNMAVLVEPVTLRYAFENRDRHGAFAAIIAVPARNFVAVNNIGYDQFYDNLVNGLVRNCDAHSMNYMVLGTNYDGSFFYLDVSTNINEFLESDTPDTFEGLSATEVTTALAAIAR